MDIGRGLDAVFQPRSIAIFGASDDATKIGGRPLQFLQKYGYAGAIYPINRKGGVVQTLPAYASVAEVPEAPDLAVVAVPPEGVLDVVRDCARRGVRAAVILSSGFSEMGEAGSRLQSQISQVARDSGMRVVGPNCLGAIGIAEKSIATFSVALESAMPAAGNVGIVSQSGNLGSFTMRLAAERGVGISRLLTTGNECDVDIADGIASLAGDVSTSVILCCMETCRDGERFVKALDLAREAGKAVVVLKVGVSEAGSEAAASHTGALAGSDAVFDAVLRRAGALRVPSIEQLLEVGHAIAVVGRQRLPHGGRTALITASGGFGVLLADAASAQGLELPKLSQETRERILSVLPYASPANPVDMTAQVSSKPELLAQVLNAVAEDPVCDALILQSAAAFHVPRLRDTYIAALRQVREKHPDRLILLCCRGPREVLAQLNAMGLPTVEGIDAACATVAALVKLGKNQSRAETAAVSLQDLPPLADAAFEDEANAKAALGQAGLPMLREQVVQSLPQALDFAGGIGFPVVLKIVSPDIAHKTEVGGVVVGVQSESQLRTEYGALLERVAVKAPRARITGVLVAQMARGGTELILGTKKDPVFGPVVMVGLGGIFAEVLRDVALETAPVDEAQALAMLRSLKAFALLDGARGRPKADVQAAAQAIVKLSRFAARHADRVTEIDINPLLVQDQGQGAWALDALLVRESAGANKKDE
ncbi:acetate--CoA ligase family protein [Variovorax sp. OV329]|uniref:acetate--CoA ligase family protein n=1 Tax=Variovorax sp. OV329 TaxID=1882825 RepID=UPI0008F4341D|nr:acetate--CoA ligase family protein [Variovorax sp. OV329]SFM18600.1 Acyl-CoA synthetase (NDP forming) [Variovorax sp. OV329]